LSWSVYFLRITLSLRLAVSGLFSGWFAFSQTIKSPHKAGVLSAVIVIIEL